MDFIQDIIGDNSFPVLTAFLLGIIVALHPCPLAANVAVMGYIAKDAHDRHRVFVNGLAYTAGRMLAYSLLGVVLLAVLRGSGGVEAIGRWFAEWGERLLGPVLCAIGCYFMLECFIHRHEHCPDVPARGRCFGGFWGSMVLGVVLALSFCPESAIVYFGMLMPLSARSAGGYLLPVVFAIAMSMPTVLMAWAVAYGISGTDAISTKMHAAQRWIDLVVGVVFVGAGLFWMFN